MTRTIFITLPVADLPRSLAFYEAVGATPDPRFSDASAVALSFSDAIHVMLMTHERVRDFTARRIVDPRVEAQVGFTLSVESREGVDACVARGVAAGGTADTDPAQDHEFMVSRSIADPDGHVWDMMWMDVEAMTAAQASPETA